MQLIDAKFKVNGAKCRLDMTFRNQIVDLNGKAKMKTVSMGFMKGMPLEDYTAGLRALADHIENEVKPSLANRVLKVVTGKE